LAGNVERGRPQEGKSHQMEHISKGSRRTTWVGVAGQGLMSRQRAHSPDQAADRTGERRRIYGATSWRSWPALAWRPIPLIQQVIVDDAIVAHHKSPGLWDHDPVIHGRASVSPCQYLRRRVGFTAAAPKPAGPAEDWYTTPAVPDRPGGTGSAPVTIMYAGEPADLTINPDVPQAAWDRVGQT